jgi:hypothetical protein
MQHYSALGPMSQKQALQAGRVALGGLLVLAPWHLEQQLCLVICLCGWKPGPSALSALEHQQVGLLLQQQLVGASRLTAALCLCAASAQAAAAALCFE